MVDITIDKYVEEEYFDDLCIACAAYEISEENIEKVVHHLMDLATHGNMLDTDQLDKQIDLMMGVA